MMQRDNLALRGATLLVGCTMILLFAGSRAGLALLIGGAIGIEIELALDKRPR